MSEIGGDKENNLKVAISRDKGGQMGTQKEPIVMSNYNKCEPIVMPIFG